MKFRARIEAALRRAGEVLAEVRRRRAEDRRHATWLSSDAGQRWLGQWRTYLLLNICGCIQSNDWSVAQTHPGCEPSPLEGLPLGPVMEMCRTAPTLSAAIKKLPKLYAAWRMHLED